MDRSINNLEGLAKYNIREGLPGITAGKFIKNLEQMFAKV